MERDPVQVIPGESFRLNPNLEGNIREEEMGIVRDEIEIEVVGVGKGHIRFIEMLVEFYENIPIVFPAGRTLPFTIEASFHDLTEEQLKSMEFYVGYGTTEYEGLQATPDEDALKNDGVAEAHYYTYFENQEDDGECNLLFPREALDSVYFRIRT